MLPQIQCRMCDADGRTPEGLTCGVCLGRKALVATCELCRTDVASHWDDNGQPRCDTCAATINRNEAA